MIVVGPKQVKQGVQPRVENRNWPCPLGSRLHFTRERNSLLGVRRQGAERHDANPDHRIWLVPASGSLVLSALSPCPGRRWQ